MSEITMQNMLDNINEAIKLYNLKNTGIALSFTGKELAKSPDRNTAAAYHNHSISVAWMILELHMPVESFELDKMMAAALCHVIPEQLDGYETKESFERAGLDPEVAEIVKLITRSGQMTEAEEKVFYERIMENRLAYMIRLVDRSNLIEQLCQIAPLEAKSYILETKKFILPMCIYGKEHYPEFYGGISILMEKMRCLIQIMDVLFARYDTEESELNNDILNLKEENSRLRGMINDFN